MKRPLTDQIVDDLETDPAQVAMTPPGDCYECGTDVGDQPAGEYEFTDGFIINIYVCDQCWHEKMNDDERAHIGLA